MDPTPIRFDDGAAYEGFMGRWSHRAGDAFLDWLAPSPGGAWLDVGCGNGAFTELLAQRVAPTRLHGIDPSEGQLAYARTRVAAAPATFEPGDAMALPVADGAFDAAVMALVLFFVPVPAKGVAEMVRAVRPGGSVSAYAWDMFGGGFPYAAIHVELAASGVTPPWPPSPEASRADALGALWAGAGLVEVEQVRIDVERRFDDFETFWRLAQTGPFIAPDPGAMEVRARDDFKERVRGRLGAGASGPFMCRAHANAIKGRVAG